MYATHTRDKFYLLRLQIIIILSLCSLVGLQGQNLNYDNLWDYDEQNVHYGFLIGIHRSDYRIKYNDDFVSPRMDSLHSIAPGKHFGFKLGFVVDFYVFQYLLLNLFQKENYLKFLQNDHFQVTFLREWILNILNLLLAVPSSIFYRPYISK